MTCLRLDDMNESSCPHAEMNLLEWCPKCTHPCVKEVFHNFLEEQRKRVALEEKLEKYRKAVRPFLENCRTIVSMADEQEKK